MSLPGTRRGDIWWVGLDPAQGGEIRKTRPAVVLTHNTLNRHRRTVVVVPLSTAAGHHPPITVSVTCADRPAVAVIDQIRAVAKHRLRSRLGTMVPKDMARIEQALKQVLALG